MICTRFTLQALALAAFMATSSLSKVSPLTKRANPPTGTLVGKAQYSDFDGISACGTILPADKALVAIDGKLFDSIDEPCGFNVTITAPNGVSKVATVQESCGDGCGTNGLLLTTSLFQDFYALKKGTFKATWRFNYIK